jgi:hypothetical protein
MSATDMPALHLTVAANLEKLRQDLGDAKTLIDTTVASFTRASGAAPAMTTLANATRAVGESAQRATTFAEDLRGALGRFDGVLNSVGLNISAGTRAIDEIAQSAGKSALQIGALSTAGLALGVGIGAWELTRGAMQFFDLDKSVEGAWRQLLHYGDVSAEVAGAKQDTINRAIAQGAAATIDYAGAVKFLTDQQKEAAAAQKAYEAGVKALTEAGHGWQQTLDTIDGSVVQAIKMYLDAGVSQKDLAAAYGLTAAQVRAVAEARQQDIETIKLWDHIHKETFELAQQHERQYREEALRGAAERNKAVVDGFNETKKAEAALSDYLIKTTVSDTDYQIKKIWEVVDEQERAFKGTEEQRARFNAVTEELATKQTDMLKAKAKEAEQAAQAALNAQIAMIPDIGHGPETPNAWSKLNPKPIGVSTIAGTVDLSKANGANTDPVLWSYLSMGYSLTEAMAIVGGYAGNIKPPQARAVGGPVSAGSPYVVGERGPELFVPSAAGTIVPNGAGGGTTIVSHITINGNVLSSEDKLQRVVNDAVVNGLKNAGVRLPWRS